MNIYIRIEVLRREFEGRLWLAMVAAERGHRVLLGKLRTRDFVGSGPDLYAPGIFHDKSLTPRPSRYAFQQGLTKRGFVLTSQDEEHGLTLEDMTGFLSERFSRDSLQNAKASFAWGPQEVEELTSLFPDQASKLYETGSPRVDLWRADMDSFHDRAAIDAEGVEGNFVLIVSSFSPFSINPIWLQIDDARGTYIHGLNDESEFDAYRRRGQVHFFFADFLRAIRLAAARFPDLTFVVRPHPFEDPRAWSSAIGPVPNVVISATGSISPWIAHASAIVHHGSTTALEATIRGVPVIAFDPPSANSEPSFVHRFGQRATSPEQLVELLLSQESQQGVMGVREVDRVTVCRRVAALEGYFAAERIVDVWESFDDGTLSERRRASRKTHRGLRHTVSHWARRPKKSDRTNTDAPKMDSDHKFPDLSEQSVRSTAKRLAKASGRCADVEVRLVSNRVIEVLPRA